MLHTMYYMIPYTRYIPYTTCCVPSTVHRTRARGSAEEGRAPQVQQEPGCQAGLSRYAVHGEGFREPGTFSYLFAENCGDSRTQFLFPQ